MARPFVHLDTVRRGEILKVIVNDDGRLEELRIAFERGSLRPVSSGSCRPCDALRRLCSDLNSFSGDTPPGMQGLDPHMARIAKERPERARKISRFRPDLALQLIKPAARSGFPNR